jgi:hypothetical protein
MARIGLPVADLNALVAAFAASPKRACLSLALPVFRDPQ